MYGNVALADLACRDEDESPPAALAAALASLTPDVEKEFPCDR